MCLDADAVLVSTRKLLVVEPDNLTLWSVSTFLRRWFAVDSTASPAGAEHRLRAQPVDALVLSDQLPPAAIDALVELARCANPLVHAVLLVGGAGEPPAAPPATRLEKPFQLSELARCLGVPDTELVP
jgi:DNA-binding NtrC family response regulator